MKLEPANIICPVCGNGNYMRHLIGKDVGYLDMKCINCNSYFNSNEFYELRVEEVWKPKPIINADRIRAMSVEEMAEIMVSNCPPNYPHGDCREYEKWDGNLDCQQCWLDWLKGTK